MVYAMEKECKVCYKVFPFKWKWNPCCSRECLTQRALKDKPERVRYCVMCQTPFYFFPYQKKMNCCSWKCAHDSLKGTINYKNRKKVVISCEYCQKQKEIPPCRYNRGQRCCSQKCSFLNRKGKFIPWNRGMRKGVKTPSKFNNCIICKNQILYQRKYCKDCLILRRKDIFKESSLRMKYNNPMKKEDICIKQSGTRKRLFEEGKLNRYFMRNIPIEQKKELAEKHRLMMIEQWKKPSFRDKVITNWLKATQNQPSSYEKNFMKICEDNNLPFKYVGNGAFLLGGKNPDFVNEEKKVCIEVYASFMKIKEFGTIENWKKIREDYFKKYGFVTIFFNEKEYNDTNYILEKLAIFK